MRHLESTKCIYSTPLGLKVGQAFKQQYEGLFNHGINPHSIVDATLPAYAPHPTKQGTYHVPITFLRDLPRHLAEKGLSNYHPIVQNLMSTNRWIDVEVSTYLAAENSQVRELFAVWDSNLSHAQLTSVGIALGHAYMRGHGMKASLDDWID